MSQVWMFQALASDQLRRRNQAGHALAGAGQIRVVVSGQAGQIIDQVADLIDSDLVDRRATIAELLSRDTEISNQEEDALTPWRREAEPARGDSWGLRTSRRMRNLWLMPGR
ncbi:MAG: hypothetical protein EXR58_05560 [Chloroflexi bacterium]|nr:hypothetical protein [Chloroflexota bacterium]